MRDRFYYCPNCGTKQWARCSYDDNNAAFRLDFDCLVCGVRSVVEW